MSTEYYASLSQAVKALNGDTSIETVAQETAGAMVWVTDDQRRKVFLLADAVESQLISVTRNLDLVLNDHSLTFTAPGAYLQFAAGTDCRILGAGGSIVKAVEDAGSANVFLVDVIGSRLSITGGEYLLNCSTGGVALAVRATNACKLLELESCTVKVTNPNKIARCIQSAAAHLQMNDAHLEAEGGTSAKCIISNGGVEVTRSTLEARSSGENAMAVHSMGGIAVMEGCMLKGTAENFPAYTLSVNAGTLELNHCSVYAASTQSNAYAAYVSDGTVRFSGCDVHADTYAKSAYGIEILKGSLDIENSSITSTAHAGLNASSTGILNRDEAVLKVHDTTILADSTPNCEDAGNNTYGITNYGVAKLRDATVYGNHSALRNLNGGKVYVTGGKYSGYCHGGFYFCHSSDGEAYVNDVMIRGGRYCGIFDYTDVDKLNICYAALYIGGESNESNSNITVYMDGCMINAFRCVAPIVLRGTGGEQNNTLNMSNCRFIDTTKRIRIDNATHKVNVGLGMNLNTIRMKNQYEDGTAVNYIQAGLAVATGALYRKLP